MSPILGVYRLSPYQVSVQQQGNILNLSLSSRGSRTCFTADKERMSVMFLPVIYGFVAANFVVLLLFERVEALYFGHNVS